MTDWSDGMENYWKTQEQKDILVKKIKDVIDADILNDEDVLAILEICRNAADREITDVTEQYLVDRLKGE